jgi:hypothetical protein
MKYTRNFLTIAFVFVLLIGASVISASAQTRGSQRIVVRRPVVVRPIVVRPYYGYRRYWNRRYDPFYSDLYFYDPYLNAQCQRYYLQQELRGNQRELEKHLKKYRADGVITTKEREELNDDYRDIEKAKRKLAEFNRRY